MFDRHQHSLYQHILWHNNNFRSNTQCYNIIPHTSFDILHVLIVKIQCLVPSQWQYLSITFPLSSAVITHLIGSPLTNADMFTGPQRQQGQEDKCSRYEYNRTLIWFMKSFSDYQFYKSLLCNFSTEANQPIGQNLITHSSHYILLPYKLWYILHGSYSVDIVCGSLPVTESLHHVPLTNAGMITGPQRQRGLRGQMQRIWGQLGLIWHMKSLFGCQCH